MADHGHQTRNETCEGTTQMRAFREGTGDEGGTTWLGNASCISAGVWVVGRPKHELSLQGKGKSQPQDDCLTGPRTTSKANALQRIPQWDASCHRHCSALRVLEGGTDPWSSQPCIQSKMVSAPW